MDAGAMARRRMVSVSIATSTSIARAPPPVANESRRYDPRRDRRQEVLSEKGSQRLVLPSLDVTSRPIVDKAHSEYMLFHFACENWLAERIPRADEHAEFEFEIELLRRCEHGANFPVLPQLTPRPSSRIAAHDDG